MANVETHDNQVPPLEKVVMGDQVLVVPPLMTDGEIRSSFLTLDQAMTYQANVVTSMTAEVNIEIGPRVPQYANTIASRLRDFTRMNQPMFFESQSDEEPQNFLDKVYKFSIIWV